MLTQGYINVYRSGYFHRTNKPNAFDRHGGDIYPTELLAIEDISPMSHYIATVPVYWNDPQELIANHPEARPVPLSATRKEQYHAA